MSQISDSEYQAAVDLIFAKAATDPSFHARALSDAPAAIKEATGRDLPEGVTVRFVEFGKPGSSESPDYVISLPPGSADDLADSDLLDSVAGGRVSESSYGQPAPKREAI